jgi:hypothetical protein
VHRSACCQQGAANLLFVVPIPLTSPPHTQNANTHQNTTQMEGIGYKVDGVEGIKASGLHVVHEVKPGQPLSQGTVVTLTLAETSACIPYVNSPPQVPWALGNGPKGGVVVDAEHTGPMQRGRGKGEVKCLGSTRGIQHAETRHAPFALAMEEVQTERVQAHNKKNRVHGSFGRVWATTLERRHANKHKKQKSAQASAPRGGLQEREEEEEEGEGGAQEEEGRGHCHHLAGSIGSCMRHDQGQEEEVGGCSSEHADKHACFCLKEAGPCCECDCTRRRALGGGIALLLAQPSEERERWEVGGAGGRGGARDACPKTLWSPSDFLDKGV